jgi:protein-arginine kinase activator protein McsA
MNNELAEQLRAMTRGSFSGRLALQKYSEMLGRVHESMQTHIICPFCENGHAIPADFDAIHRCGCGACYKVCGNQALDHGVKDIAEEIWSEEELNFIRTVPMDFCNVVIEKEFDRLLDLKRALDPNVIERFCKYDSNNDLSLVWVKRLF